tara:strand:+ start:91 stop:771 length:681 start_codon:yes stop_codon:yes gene_type:complete
VNENDILNQLKFQTENFQSGSFLLSIIICFLLSFLLSKVYIRKSRTFSNPKSLARVLPIISLTTTIIIGVVKSSLALSLGLVGALSIVRFRTPIKEPEEISYIFLSIAIGLATGAYQFKAAILGLLLVIVFIYLYDYLERKKSFNNYIRISVSGIKRSEINKVVDILSENCEKVIFNSMNISSTKNDEETLLSLSIIPENFKKINKLTEKLYSSFPNCTLNLLDID